MPFLQNYMATPLAMTFQRARAPHPPPRHPIPSADAPLSTPPVAMEADGPFVGSRTRAGESNTRNIISAGRGATLDLAQFPDEDWHWHGRANAHSVASTTTEERNFPSTASSHSTTIILVSTSITCSLFCLCSSSS
jgi:hypothetical protein